MELVVTSTAKHKYTTVVAGHRNPQSDESEVETINYSKRLIFHMRAGKGVQEGVGGWGVECMIEYFMYKEWSL